MGQNVFLPRWGSHPGLTLMAGFVVLSAFSSAREAEEDDERDEYSDKDERDDYRDYQGTRR